MALNTREYRAAAVATFPAHPPTVTPNATPDQEWRQESGWTPSSVSAGGAGGAGFRPRD